MTKQDIIQLVLDKKRKMPFGVDEEEYIFNSVKNTIAFEPNSKELEEVLKEVLAEMKNSNDKSINSIESQERLMEYLIEVLSSHTRSFENTVMDVNYGLRSEFIKRVINGLQEYDIKMDESMMLNILNQENRKITETSIDIFSDNMKKAINGDVETTVYNINRVRNSNLTNEAINERYINYGESIYRELVEYIKSDNLRNPSFCEKYYDIINNLKRSVRIYEEIYKDTLSNEFKKLSNKIDVLLKEVMYRKQAMHYKQEFINNEKTQTTNETMFL